MTNPFDLAYLTTATNAFGPFAWAFAILQVVLLVVGVAVINGRQTRDPLLNSMRRQMAIATLVMGSVGLLLVVLRLSNVPFFNQRFWLYVQLLVEAGLAGYVYYYLRTVYPRLKAAQQQTNKGKGGASVRRPTPPKVVPVPSVGKNGNGDSSTESAAPVATLSGNSRRDSRRERKRKSR
ncbi:MAG: hypothetical protein MUD01_11440 [Chloroflexaceae bacterium]|jgi:membrane protein implicated in regulation of membrane protease activity|nr:hypothetical protein [Chloroflexaceae bacterium]